MSTPSLITPLTMCDECGRSASKICRVYHGHRYCGTCYVRVFKRQLCPCCNNYARLPKNDSGAVCRACESNSTCARCHVMGFAVAKITPYGPVCPSCAPYFREPKPCERCGVTSSRLTQVSRLGNGLQICEKCARADYKTCVACRRHRRCESDETGRPMCSTCRHMSDKPCSTCGVSMPAGRGDQCESCYWRGLAIKRLDINAQGFLHTAIQQNFLRFGSWLIDQVGAHKAALTLQRYVEFFQALDQYWGRIPNYESLLAQFGAEGLRRVRLPMRWMAAVGLVSIEPALRKSDSERRSIEVLLSAFETESVMSRILTEFYQMLLQREAEGTTSLRSIRLNMTPAVALLRYSIAKNVMPPSQKMLQGYLTQKPGQRAALSAFVGYLRRQYGLAIELPKRRLKTPAQLRGQLAQQLQALLGERIPGEGLQARWITLGLAYFHDLPQRVGAQISPDQVLVEADGGMTVLWAGNRYYLPAPNDGLIPKVVSH